MIMYKRRQVDQLSDQRMAAQLILLLLLTLSSQAVSTFPFGINATNPLGFLNNTNWGAWDPFQKLAGCQKGDNRTGIAGLKKYFHRFGYIPDVPASNYSDNFDDVLEWALRTYQQNFNLNATGQLDASTLQQLVRPRCGNADIVNGTSTMNSREGGDSSIHSVRRFTFFPGRPTWPSWRRDLTYSFVSSSAQPNGGTQTLSAVFSRAFARWSEVIPITFTEATAGGRQADIQISFFDGDHGDGEAFDGVLGTLAHAFSPPDGRFHLDGAENWNVESLFVSSSAIDLESVAVHEIGHLLGLGHSSEPSAIMYPTISAGARKVQLADDDVNGVQQLYGSNPDFNGTTSGSTVPGQASRERDTSDGEAQRGWQWGGVVLPAAVVAAAVIGL